MQVLSYNCNHTAVQQFQSTLDRFLKQPFLKDFNAFNKTIKVGIGGVAHIYAADEARTSDLEEAIVIAFTHDRHSWIAVWYQHQ